MTRASATPLALAVVIAAGGAGYWLGRQGVPHDVTAHLPALSAETAPGPGAPAPSGPVIYHRDPDNRPIYSLEPKATGDGRPFRPVHASEDTGFDARPSGTVASEGKSARGARRILYYRNPMGLPDTSPVPKKDSMGMDYIPVHEGEEQDGSTVRLSPGRVQRTGVKTEHAERRVIVVPVRAPGTIQLDERRIAVISMRSEAWIDKVEDVTTGSEVRTGQPLMHLYSPAIAGVAAEYVSALGPRTDPTTTATLTSGTRQRLANLAVPPQVIAEIERTRKVPLTFTWPAPRDGIVLERNVVDGTRVMPGDVLFRVADHSAVWALVDISERDLAAVAKGQPVTVRVRSYPDRVFEGKVALVYPHLNAATRTVRVRIDLSNPDLLLRPDMYLDAEIGTAASAPVTAVPVSAVIDSGTRQVVIIDKGEGRFEPRAVRLGRRNANHVEIREGVEPGETVVVSANFLIDAESNLKAALQGLDAAEQRP
jgi:Cu(I)/Ag(I) efflux system membrane fusion protein